VKAVLLREIGGPEQLECTEIRDPEPREGQTLVRVRAAGINFLDILVRQGRYPQPALLPTILGAEVAGDVDGRRMMGLPHEGGYAELVAVDDEWLVPLPGGASFEEGAAFLLTFLTSYLPLRRASVGPGATVLVHAGAGGVGSAAVQLARHFGARVVATASSAEKRRWVLDLGADEAYGYDEFDERVRADVVLDPVGGAVLTRSLPILNPLGMLVAIGFAGGPWEDLNPALLLGRNVAVQGLYLGRLMRHRPDVVREAIAELVELWTRGAVRPAVGARYPLADAPAAHRLIEERRHVGKVVLVP
jgi:NADPH2:quinone reductase